MHFANDYRDEAHPSPMDLWQNVIPHRDSLFQTYLRSLGLEERSQAGYEVIKLMQRVFPNEAELFQHCNNNRKSESHFLG